MLKKLKYSYKSFLTYLYRDNFSSRYSAGKKVPPPVYVSWDSTRRCNLSCVHCGAAKQIYKYELSTEKLKNLADQMSEMKVPLFGATGGEPLLRNDLLDVFEYSGSKGLKTTVATNGFLLDKKKVSALKEIDLWSLMVSLDGPKDVHNKIRGNEESFQRATAGIRYALEANLPIVTVSSVVTGTNLSHLNELRKVLIDVGVKRWRLTTVMPIGRSDSFENQKEAIRILNEAVNYAITNSSQELRISLSENMPYLGPKDYLVSGRPISCPVGFTTLCIGVDGKIRGCPEQPDDGNFTEGDSNKNSLDEIWQKKFFRYRELELRKNDEKCKNCNIWDKCYGGCWVMRLKDIHCYKALDALH